MTKLNNTNIALVVIIGIALVYIAKCSTTEHLKPKSSHEFRTGKDIIFGNI